MLLAIDCGNTQTVIGLFSDREIIDHWRIATAAERTSDELALMFQQFLGFHGFSFDAHVSGVVIASGVPRVTAALREMTERYFGYEALVLEPLADLVPWLKIPGDGTVHDALAGLQSEP